MTTPAGQHVVTGDAAFQNEVLDEVAGAANYHAWLVSLVEDQLGDDPLEIGSGMGEYAAALSSQGQRITASEAFGPSLTRLNARFAQDARVRVREIIVPSDELGSYSAVIAFNVLEHIPDDGRAVQTMRQLVRPGGAVMLFVPAFNALMSDYDRRVGHQRRYRARELRQLLEASGLTVETLHYVNAPGFFAWFVGMRVLKGRPKDSLALRIWDRWVMRPTRWIETRRRPPFGQSLFIVARRTE